MGVFHRWTSAATVREHWPVLRAEFGRGFISFCEKQMQLGVVEGYPKRLRRGDVPGPALERLAREFADQWPKLEGLSSRVASVLAGDEDHRGWLIYPDDDYPAAADCPERNDTPCGIVLVSPEGEGPDTGPPTYEL